MKDILEIGELLKESKTITVVSHPMPDGDAFGSMLSLSMMLEKMGHTVYPISPTGWGDFLAWMPGVDKITDFSKDQKEAKQKIYDSSIIFCLDFNNPDRIGILKPFLFHNSKTTVLIDHHLNPDLEYFDYGISQPEKSSTSEMVYDFIQAMSWDGKMDEDVMTCIYTGLLTDTGSFRFPATTSSVHLAVAEFKKRGLRHHLIHEQLFDNNSIERMRFLGYLLSNKMQFVPERKLCFLGVSNRELEKYGVSLFDLEGIVNILLSIQGVEIAALLSERENEVKISMRSVGDIDVAELCQKYFSGGGHKNAAGGKLNLNLTESLEKFLEIMQD